MIIRQSGQIDAISSTRHSRSQPADSIGKRIGSGQFTVFAEGMPVHDERGSGNLIQFAWFRCGGCARHHDDGWCSDCDGARFEVVMLWLWLWVMVTWPSPRIFFCSYLFIFTNSLSLCSERRRSISRRRPFQRNQEIIHLNIMDH